MKRNIMLLAAMLINIGSMMADEVGIDDVTIPQGGQATVNIWLTNPDKEYTAGQMLLILPDGVSAVLKNNGDPVTTKGNRLSSTTHSIGASHLEDGTNQFTIFSIDSEAIPETDGILFTVTVTANVDLSIGTTLQGCLSNIEMTTASDTPTPVYFVDKTFTITIGEPADTRVLLDEATTTKPAAATGVDVRVKRTIKANEWSTICLPFAMTAEQVKAAFGEDVELGDFKSWTPEEDDEGAIVGITVGFTDATEIEANHPYIIKVSAAVSEFTVDGVDIEPEEELYVRVGKKAAERGWMYGTYAVTTVPEENLFLSGNKFWYSTGQTTIKAFRGYFEFRDVLDAYYDETEAPVFITFGGETTAVNDELRMKSEASSDVYYTLDGRAVKTPQRGVYIKNGKKVIVK